MIILRRKNFSSPLIVSRRGSRWRDYKPYPTKKIKDTETGEIIDTGEELPRPGWNSPNNRIRSRIVLLDGKHYQKDKENFKGHKEDEKRIEQLRESLRRGNVFDNDPYDATEYTHLIRKTKNSYVYSKDINVIDRMVYSVSKPEIIYDDFLGEDVVIFKVTILNLREHKINEKRYSR